MLSHALPPSPRRTPRGLAAAAALLWLMFLVLLRSFRRRSCRSRSCGSLGSPRPLGGTPFNLRFGILVRWKSQTVGCWSYLTQQVREDGMYPSAVTVSWYSPGFRSRQKSPSATAVREERRRNQTGFKPASEAKHSINAKIVCELL